MFYKVSSRTDLEKEEEEEKEEESCLMKQGHTKTGSVTCFVFCSTSVW